MLRFVAVRCEVLAPSDLLRFHRRLAFGFAGTGPDREGPASLQTSLGRRT